MAVGAQRQLGSVQGPPKRREVGLTKKGGPWYHISPCRCGEILSHLEQFSVSACPSEPAGVPWWPPAVSFYYGC